MKCVALAACIAVFTTLCSAGQDRAVYPAAGGPGQGGVIRNIRIVGSTYWAAIEGGGIYKSTDGGASWSASHQGIDDRIVRVISGDPANSAIMYAVTLQGGGFYKSVDGGATWARSNSGLDCVFITNMLVVATGVNSGRIFLSTTCGVYVSNNQGASWSLAGTGVQGTSVTSLGGTLDGATLRAHATSGFYVSFDSGATWQIRNGTIPNVLSGPLGPSVFGTAFAGPNLLATVDGNGAFYSSDFGMNWFPVTGLPANAQLSPMSFVGPTVWTAVDGAGIYKSTDSGVNWSPETGFNGLPAKSLWSFFRVGAGPDYLAATRAGFYKSTDNGANWVKMSNGLPQGFVINATSHPSTPQVVFAAADTIYKSIDGGATWAASDTGLGGLTYFTYHGGRFGVVQVDPGNPAVVYASTANMGMFKSTDTGATWFPINNGLPAVHASHGGNFRISISNPNVLYLPLNLVGSLYKTIDGGANWTNVSIPSQFARAPAIDPTNPDIVHVATSGGLYKSTNGGAPGSWVLKNPSGIPFGVTRPQVLSTWPSMVLLAVHHTDSRGVATPVSGVYLSTNGGDTWRQLVANEKVTQAIFVSTHEPAPPAKVGVYIVTFGNFDDARPAVFKCENILVDFTPEKCREIDLGPDPGQPRSFLARPNRMISIATSSGLAKHRFLHLGQDFNNDGRADILWRHSVSSENPIWHMNGTGFFGEGSDAFGELRSASSNWVIAGLGDFDGNGSTNVLWRRNPTGELYIWLEVEESFVRIVADQNWQVAGVGDFDGDGKSDILWRNASTGENYVYFIDGLQIVNEGYIRTVADTNWSVAAVGDFDGDFKADILWRNGATGENYLYPMDGLTIKPTEGYLRTVPIAWTVKGLGDFNADNKMDIVWRNGSTGQNYVYPMDGTTILADEGYLPTVTEAGWSIAAIGDFDGEGTTIRGRGQSDILWRNSISGAAYLWRLSGSTNIVWACGAMACQSGYLPLVSDTNWQIVNQ
jgi:photosystem II stability/assembly factor-like uncharacterized protein